MNAFKNFIELSNSVLEELSSNKGKENIYHYTGVVGFKSIIENSTLRFTDRFYLNDKSEGVYILELFRDNFDYIVADTPLNKEKDKLLYEINEYIEHIQEKDFKIFQVSFSLNKDNLCMWNYYTKVNGIKGFNIGFDSSSLCESIVNNINEEEEKPYLLSGRIIYDKDNQLNKLKKFVTLMYNAILADEKERYVSKPDEKAISSFINRTNMILERITLLGVFFKKTCFAIEEEYRLAVDLYVSDGKAANITEKIEYMCKDNGFIMPYIDFRFDLKAVTEIVVSPTMDIIETQKNMKVFLAGRGIDDVDVKESDIPVRF